MNHCVIIQQIQQNIATCRIQLGIPETDSYPHLLAVSKTQSLEAIVPWLEAGHQQFAENRVQEATQKWLPLKAQFPHTELHLIGSLQTNKVDEAVAVFDVIQTIDREKLAIALANAMQKAGRNLPCMVQVNIGEEPQKAGCHPQETAALVATCQQLGLTITGLMCIPPAEENPAPYFALLKAMSQQFHLPHTSMGMSRDYPLAAALGATHIRLGAALFGER